MYAPYGISICSEGPYATMSRQFPPQNCPCARGISNDGHF